ncbi:MAG TPA: S41 family peptidase [Vicinamibacteria bacterium]
MLVVAGTAARIAAQPPRLSEDGRERGVEMLHDIKKDIERHYYDPTFHGVDLDARFKAAEAKVRTAQSDTQIIGIIAQALIDLNDSHTFFAPPPLAVKVTYGWRMQMIGDKCHVVAVKPKSAAEARELGLGDEVVSVDGAAPTREGFWRIRYYLGYRPQPAVKLALRRPDGRRVELEVPSNVVRRDPISTIDDFIAEFEDRYRVWEAESQPLYHDLGEAVLIAKMPTFAVKDEKADEIVKKAREHKALVLDLRGNHGGFADLLKRFAGYFFDHDVKLDEVRRRKDTKPEKADSRGPRRSFTGPLVVLIDSESASASEIFARLIQLEKRGTVIGDRSAGAVMESMFHPHRGFGYRPFFYGASITVGDVIMSDGKSLERTGVTPDETVLPSAMDLKNRRDPALSRAAELLGGKLDAEKAGTLFPIRVEE